MTHKVRFFFEREDTASDVVLDHRSKRVEPQEESIKALLLLVGQQIDLLRVEGQEIGDTVARPQEPFGDFRARREIFRWYLEM